MQTPNAKNGVVLGGAGCYRVVKEEVEVDVEVVVPCCSDDDDDDDDDGVVVVAHSHSKRSNNEITAGTGINSIWEKLDSAGTQKDIYTPNAENPEPEQEPDSNSNLNSNSNSPTCRLPDTDIANTIKMKEKSIAEPSKREYSLSCQLIGLWCHKLHESHGDKGHGILIKGSFTNYMLLGFTALHTARLFQFLIVSVIGNTLGLSRRPR